MDTIPTAADKSMPDPISASHPPDAEGAGIRPHNRWFVALLLLGVATLFGQLVGLDKVVTVALDEGKLSAIEKQLIDRRQSMTAIDHEYDESQKKLSALTPQLEKAILSLESVQKDCLDAKKQRDDLLFEFNKITKLKDAANEELAALTKAENSLKQTQQQLTDARKDLDSTKSAITLMEPVRAKREAELKELTQKSEIAMLESQKLQAKLSTMRTQANSLEGKQAEETRLDSQIAIKTEALNQITKKSIKAEVQVKDQYDAYYRQKNETEALRASVSSLTADKRTLEQDKATLKGQSEELLKQIADLKTVIGQKTQARDNLFLSIEQSFKDRDNLRKTYADLQKEISALAQEKTKLTGEVNILKQKITQPPETDQSQSTPAISAEPPPLEPKSTTEPPLTPGVDQKTDPSKENPKTVDSPKK